MLNAHVVAYTENKADAAHKELEKQVKAYETSTLDTYESILAKINKAENDIDFWENKFDEEYSKGE